MQLCRLPQQLGAQRLGEEEEESLQVLVSSRMCFTPQSYPKNSIHVPLLSAVGHYFEHLCTIFCSVLLDMIFYSTTIKTFSCEQRMQIDGLVHVQCCMCTSFTCMQCFFMLSQNDLHPFFIPTPPKLSVTL